MKKKWILFFGILILSFVIVLLFNINKSISIKTYSNYSFSVKYDSTWKVKDGNNELILTHKKSNGTLSIKVKELDVSYIDTNLNDLIKDIMYSVEEQNKEYKLISIDDNVSDKYESYSYLYENNSDNVLVNVYKKDTKLVFVYYESNIEYFDIVLDSVDEIINSLDIKSGVV